MKHVILTILVLIAHISGAQQRNIHHPIQEYSPPVQLYFGHIKSSRTTVEELLKVDSLVLFQPDIEEKHFIISCTIVIYDKNKKNRFGALNYVTHFDEGFKSKFKRLNPGDIVSATATVKSHNGPAMKMGNNVLIE